MLKVASKLAQLLGLHARFRLRDRLVSIVLVLLSTVIVQLPAMGQEPIRIGLTKAVLAGDDIAHERWANYLQRKLARPVLFVERRSYADIQQLLRLGELDFAWICGYPYVVDEQRGSARYVATPQIDGRATYNIFLIVPRDSPRGSLADLQGQIFAFSDPDSVDFRALIGGFIGREGPIRDLNSFFRIDFFTYNHVDTVKAVADGFADGGSVDGHVWEALSRLEPELTGKTRIIAQSEAYGLPPIVASSRVPEETLVLMQKVLMEMDAESEGRSILRDLHVDRFTIQPDSLYDSIRKGPAAATEISAEIGEVPQPR